MLGKEIFNGSSLEDVSLLVEVFEFMKFQLQVSIIPNRILRKQAVLGANLIAVLRYM